MNPISLDELNTNSISGIKTFISAFLPPAGEIGGPVVRTEEDVGSKAT
jgi:hypothetical protein